MSQDSSGEFQLDIKSDQSNEFHEIPADFNRLKEEQEKKDRLRTKVRLKKLFYLQLYEAVHLHSHLLQLVSVILVCGYYTLMLRVQENFITDKYYHSLSLGIICLVDFLINKEKYKDIYDLDTSLKQLMLSYTDGPELDDTCSNKSDISKDHMISVQQFYSLAITLGVVSFLSELLIYYLLNETSVVQGQNACIGFSLIAMEFIIIRMHFSLKNVSIDFINFLGIFFIMLVCLIISLGYLCMALGLISLIICILRFIRTYIFIEIMSKKYINQGQFVLWLNIVDFLIGCSLLFISILSSQKNYVFYFSDFFIMLVATVAYYINLKYFMDMDRYGHAIMAFTFPMMILFDLLINKRRINLTELILVLFVAIGVSMSFFGRSDFPKERNVNQVRVKSTQSENKEQNSNQQITK